VAVNALNELVGNLNKPGGVLAHKVRDDVAGLVGDRKLFARSLTSSEESASKSMEDSMYRLLGGIQVMLFHGVTPPNVSSIPFVASFSMFMDEATEIADLVLPDNSYLESWDIHSSYGPDGRTVVSLTQPVLKPELNTRQTADVLLSVARELRGAAADAVPFESAKQLIEKRLADFATSSGNSDSDALWKEITERGLTSPQTGETPARQEATAQSTLSNNALRFLTSPAQPQKAETQTTSALMLMVYKPSVLEGTGVANLPSIQELPDPMTSVVWGHWVEINPVTAAGLGIADGDLVEVTTEHGSLTLPALLYPAIRPDVIAIPSAQGNSNYGRYARQRGANPISLISPGADSDETVPAQVRPVGGKGQLIRFGTQHTGHKESRR
jgi:anaerobic selenocysteine-containing dehydrogenase